MVVARDVNVVATLFEIDPHTGKLGGNDAQIFKRDVLDCNLAPGHGGHTDETAHLAHIGKQGMCCSVQAVDTIDNQQVGCNARDQGSHTV